MVRLYLGPKNSGKSAAAEAFCLEHASRPLYLATLPEIAQYRQRIRRHRLRRGDLWETRYLALPLHNMLDELRRASQSHSCILLDGFSAALKVQAYFFGLQPRAIDAACDQMLALVESTQAGNRWVIVDNLPASSDGSADIELLPSLVRAHAMLGAIASTRRCEPADNWSLSCKGL